MNELNNKTTVELKVLRDRIHMELSQRIDETEVPVIKMVADGDTEYFDFDSLDENSDYINRAMKLAIKEKNRIFNIKLKMMPESDYKDMKHNGNI